MMPGSGTHCHLTWTLPLTTATGVLSCQALIRALIPALIPALILALIGTEGHGLLGPASQFRSSTWGYGERAL